MQYLIYVCVIKKKEIEIFLPGSRKKNVQKNTRTYKAIKAVCIKYFRFFFVFGTVL